MDPGSVVQVMLQTECLCPPQPPNSYVEALKPDVLALGGGTFGRLGLNEVMRVEPHDGISALRGSGRGGRAPSTRLH